MPKLGAESVVRQLFDQVWTGGDLGAVEGLLAPEFVVRHATAPGQAGAAAYAESVADVRAAFPDVHFAIDDLVVAGDRVTVRWTATATHLGAYMGVEATGRPVRVSGLEMCRVVDGRIVEIWVNWDSLGLLEQLGAVGTEVQANKDLLRRWLEEGWEAADPDAVIDELFVEDFELHSPRAVLRGRQAYRQLVHSLKEAFPDIRFTLEEAVASGDRVAYRWRGEGTHRGQYMGVSPTGRPIAITGIGIATVREGRLVATHESPDIEGLLQQIRGETTP